MRSLGGSMDTMRGIADPSRTRLGYRLQRLWLTPLFRGLIRTGIPCAIVLGLSIWHMQKPHVRMTMAVSVLQARDWVHQRPEFMVKLMSVEGTSDEVASVIRGSVHLDFPLSSFDFDLDDLRTRIEALAPVQSATVRIRPGGVLEVLATERTPALVWRTPKGLKLLDVDGVSVATIVARAEYPDLPLVAGEGADRVATEALDLVRAAAPLNDRVRGLSRIGERRWDVILDRGQVIQLPEVDAVAALERVILLNGAQDLLARDITHIDLRNPRRPTLRLAQAGLEELRRIKGIEFGVNQ